MNNKYFDREKQEKALKWLEEKWPKERRACEVCNNTHWILAEDLIRPLIFIGENLALGGTAYPHILLYCKVCANAKFFNAVMIGIENAILVEKDDR